MSESKDNSFGGILARELKRQALGKGDLAQMIGVSESTVSRWVGGETLPKPAQRRKLMEKLEMSLQSLGLMEDEMSQEEAFLKDITEIQTSDTSNGQKLQMILDYVAQIVSQKHIAQFPHPPIKRTDDTANVVQPSSTEQEAVIVRTEAQEYQFTWIGTRDVSLDNVVSIETGNKIASWRYIQNGKEQREPHNFDMHIHVCERQTIQYTPPIQLTRLHIVHASPTVRCIPRSSSLA